MGRPINYKKIGGDVSLNGEQLLFRAYFTEGVAEEDAYLVKQTGSRRFRLAAVADDARVEEFDLGQTVVQGETAVLNVVKFAPNFEITALTVTNSPTFTSVDGTYNVTISGGNPETAAEATVVIAADAIDSVTVTNGGSYPTDLSGVTLSATVAGQLVEFSATTTNFKETVRKITQHRVYTFEGDAFKYEIDVAADESNEADVITQ